MIELPSIVLSSRPSGIHVLSTAQAKVAYWATGSAAAHVWGAFNFNELQSARFLMISPIYKDNFGIRSAFPAHSEIIYKFNDQSLYSSI